MDRRMWVFGLVLAGLLGGMLPVRAEIIARTGSAAAEVHEFIAGETGDSDQASDSFPLTNETLPVQVVARLVSANEDAAGIAAAQFADPLTAVGDNPGEFAINLTLNSVIDDIYYTGNAWSEEVRGVRLTAAETGAADGATVDLTGRFYVNGALAVFSDIEIEDLTDVTLTLHVTIDKEVAGQAAESVFDGTLTLTGTSAGGITLATVGGFPRGGILLNDLTALDPNIPLFEVAILPTLIIQYPYRATVGQAFDFRARVEIDAANAPHVGVLAVLGLPINSFVDVVALTQNADLASKMSTMLEQERAAPTGWPAFATDRPLAAPFGLCGLFGVESLLGVCALAGVGAWRRGRIK